MHASSLQGFLEHLRKVTNPARPRELSDADLLERFRTQREEAAFTLLVQRHGPMVLAVCRRILGTSHETEDVFQAVFLVLVRNAEKIRKQESLAAWLHGVAARLAHKARTQSLQRQVCERKILPPTQCGDAFDTLASEELRAALDEEIERLADKYRTPLILCYLADKTHEQAARELGWPKSSVTARLAKARELLRRRLERRGFTVPAGFLAMLLTEATANAALPAVLTLSTVRVAMQAVMGETLAATATVALADSVAKGTALTKWLASLTLVAALGVAAVSPLCMTTGSPTEKPAPSAKPQPAVKAEPRKPRLDWQGDPLPDGAIARLGSGRMRHPWLRSLAFSSEGKTLLSSNEEGIRIWDTETGKLLRRFGLGRDNRQISFCRTVDNITLAILDDKWIVTVQVLDAATGKTRRRIRIKEPATVANPTLSPDGKRVALAHKNELCLYDTASGERTLRIPFEGIAAWDAAFSPDGKTIAFNDFANTVFLHDTKSGKRIYSLKRPGDTPLRSVWSPDGRFLATMPQGLNTEKGEVSIWNVRDGKEVHRFTHPFPKAMFAAFSPDGKQVAVSGVRWGLVVWDVETSKEVCRLSPHGGVLATVFSPDGKTLATASPRGAIRLWDTTTWKPLPVSTDPEMQFVHSLRFRNDGKQLVGEAGAGIVWDAATGRELQRFADPETFDFRLPTDMRCLVLSPDESLLAAANRDRTISLWDAATGKKKHVLKGHERPIFRVVFTPDSRRLISLEADAVVRVWDTANGRELHRLVGQWPLAASPDSRLLAVGDPKGARKPDLIVYDLARGRELHRFSLATEGDLLSLAFSPDSRCLAAAGTPRRSGRMGAVKIWDIAEGHLLRTWEEAEEVFWHVAFAPDGRSVATGGKSLTLWELASGRQRHSFVGHEDKMEALAFSPDGRTLAASSVDAPGYVWDVAGSLEPKPRRLSDDELQRAWTTLAAEDAKAAFQTIRRLVAVPEQTLPFLRQHLKPIPPHDPKQVRQRVEMLDSDDFATRQKATEELEKQADAAAGLLRQILEKEKPTLEVRKRLQQIVETLENKPESWRAVRAVEILEWIGTADAVRLLGEWTNGAADARLTREAISAKRRLMR